MILSVQNICKDFVEQKILENVSFHIEDHEKVALVGINGAGKTTLLKIIIGELSPDEGQIVLAKDKTIGYLPQNASVNSQNSIYDELLSVKKELIELEKSIRDIEKEMSNATEPLLSELMKRYSNLTHQFEIGGGYVYKSQLIGVLKGLGFEESQFSNLITTLSGGQKTRLALCKLLLQQPDLIILDEPTNHLDLNSITWLETYLVNYKGAVILVSHDRFFLDKITTKVIELDNTHSTTFQGNYTSYASKKEILRVADLNAYLKQQQEIKHQDQVIEKLRSFNREKSIKRAESREKALAKIDIIDKPTELNANMQLELIPLKESGKDVLTVNNLSKSFNEKCLFKDLNFQIKRGEHIAIIGDNGTGKTTILKIINQYLQPDQGSFTLGSNVEIGYYDQEHQVLNNDKTLFDEISDEYPSLTNTQIRNTLAAFLFTGDAVFKLIKDLSGGEKGRVSLAKLMLSNCNFLILDEPTNHLDIQSKEILEDALNKYTGTVLYVSHDRYFMNRTAHRILELSDCVLTNYLGNYDYYLQKKEELQTTQNEDFVNPPKSESLTSNKIDWKQQKELQALKRKKENDLKKCEKSIEELEEKKSKLEISICKTEIATNSVELQKVTKELNAIELELENLYETWEELAES